MHYRTRAELDAAVPTIDQSPTGTGTIEMIVRRPDVGEREILESAELSLSEGLVGDNWSGRTSTRTPDGSPHPDMQINMMNWRVISALAPDSDADRALAGDQLFVDLSLDRGLPDWTCFTIGAERGGTAVVQITDQPHTGCAKFRSRFGPDALRWINADIGQQLRFRGVNAKVVAAGTIRRGDQITQMP